MKCPRLLALPLAFVLASAPAHAQEAEPALTHGPFVGHVGPDEARLWARASAPGTYSLFAWDEGPTQVRLDRAEASAEGDLALHWHIEGLTAGKAYRYEVRHEDEVLAGDETMRLVTAEGDGAARARLAFGSCADDRRFPSMPAFARMREEGAEAVVLLGDTPYIDSTELAVQRERYRAFFSVPELDALMRDTPLYATWDDHDFGRNDTDGRLEGKERARQAFVEHHANPSYGDGSSGIYTRFRRGPIEVFLLDTRWFAATEPSPVDPSLPTLLGRAQWDWLLEGLAASTATFKVLACGMIWNDATRPLKRDHWGTYAHERDALLRYLMDEDIGGVVWVGGDIHRTRLLRHPTKELAGYDVPELVTSPLANFVIDLANAPSEALVHDAGVEHCFLMLEADADADPPVLSARFLEADGSELFSARYTADELEPRFGLDPSLAAPERNLLWYDASRLTVEGRGWDDPVPFWGRLPLEADARVRSAIVKLGANSAGVAVRFLCDAQQLWARWTMRSAAHSMAHMPSTGVSGLDLYARDENGAWRWVSNARPNEHPTSRANLFQGIEPGRREYMLYLPLYNTLFSLELAVEEGGEIGPAPPRPAERSAPLVFYGTSITQGACASRPGLAYPAIVGRMLDRPVVNLGFSGNGKMGAAFTDMLVEVDAAVYVIDCLPNVFGNDVLTRVVPLVHTIRQARPKTPILLVEDPTYPDGWLKEKPRGRNEASRAALRQGYEILRAGGVEDLHYLEGDGLLGHDGEATVDGVHPNDLGMLRMAEAFRAAIEPLLGPSSGG